MPKAISFRVNGRIPITDDLTRLAAVTAALSDCVARLRDLGMIGEFNTRVINTRGKRQEELVLAFPPRHADPNRYIPPLSCGQTVYDEHGGAVACYKSQGHEDWHEGETADGLVRTWPAREAVSPDPAPGGEPLPDSKSVMESLGIRGAFDYRAEHAKPKED